MHEVLGRDERAADGVLDEEDVQRAGRVADHQAVRPAGGCESSHVHAQLADQLGDHR